MFITKLYVAAQVALSDKKGAAMVEYALLAALIAVVAVTALTTIGELIISTKFSAIATSYLKHRRPSGAVRPGGPGAEISAPGPAREIRLSKKSTQQCKIHLTVCLRGLFSWGRCVARICSVAGHRYSERSRILSVSC